MFGDKHPEFMYNISILYQLVVSQMRINSDTAMYNRSSPMCTLCPSNVAEISQHPLYDYSAFDMIRHCVWKNVNNVAPIVMLQELKFS